MSLTCGEKFSSEPNQHTSTSKGEERQMVDKLYQSLNSCLNNPGKTYKERIDALSTAWEMFASLKGQSSHVIRYFYRDTVMLVLQSEWGKLKKVTKTHLKATLQKAVTNLFNTHACNLCQRALRVVTDPWNHPVVIKIINDLPISECEGRDFFLTEMPILLTARLDRLCWDDKCKDLALKLVTFCRKSFRDSRCLLEPVCSVVCQQLWIDLHVTLVYICNEKDDFAVMLERHVSEGYDIVNRLIRRTSESNGKTKENSGINRIWREHGLETADFASQCLLSTALIRCPPPSNLSPLAIQFVNLQKAIGKSSQDVIKKLHKMIYNDQLQKIMTPAHMYILGATLSDTFRNDFKPFGIELYVKAVAADLNILESQKLNQDGDGIRIAEISLAVAFSKLAEFLHANLRICREIALTAFSLHPTKERFDKLVELVCEQVAKEMSEPTAAEESLSRTGEHKVEIPSKLPQDGETQLPYSDSDATALGLSEAIIRDLASIVHSVRWDVLTWKNGWKELEPLCRRYMVDQENMRSVTKELLFLKVDYNQFKDMPRLERGENWGIEKGYEKCLEAPARFRKHSRCQLKRKSKLRANIGLLARNKSLKTMSLSRGRSKQKPITRINIRMRQASKRIISPPVAEGDIDSQECKATPEVSGVPKGVKRSARIKTRKLRNATLPQESSSLVKRLREIRLKPENMEEWRKLNLPTRTRDLAELPRKCGQLNCLGSSDVSSMDYFAPMLSTLDMQPKVFLTRISVSRKKLSVYKKDGKSSADVEVSAIYDPLDESDIDEFHSPVVKGYHRFTAGQVQLKNRTENVFQERYRGVSDKIDSPNQNGNRNSCTQQEIREQAEPGSSTFDPLLSRHSESGDATRGDLHSAPFISFSNFAARYPDSDMLLQSLPSSINLPQAPYQSVSDDCRDVLQLDTGGLVPVHPRLRKRSLSPPSSVCLERPSHNSAELSIEGDMEASPPLLQPDLTLSEQCRTSEKSPCSPGKQPKLECNRSTIPRDGTLVASTTDSTPNQLRKQRERQWCPECGFPKSGRNPKECTSQDEPYLCAESSSPQKSFDNQDHLPEDCKQIQTSNQVILAWIKWLQLEMNPEESSYKEKANSSLVEDLHLLIVELCNKSEDTRAAQLMARNYLRSYCIAQRQSISLPQPLNNVLLLNLFDWFPLLIFQPEALSDTTKLTYLNVLAFLISLLIEEQPTLAISGSGSTKSSTTLWMPGQLSADKNAGIKDS